MEQQPPSSFKCLTATEMQLTKDLSQGFRREEDRLARGCLRCSGRAFGRIGSATLILANTYSPKNKAWGSNCHEPEASLLEMDC
ncbi:hypothetical protein TorRG33x02_145860 [Trema orientale]|uniref:Uncharacterized protein n=1 Tax=Trema orientale TaxID=63057 RepID=A0A2P5EVN4_TREOI|nr:hypothetical protein TorRG33x02_145860 [Trema orientale]